MAASIGILFSLWVLIKKMLNPSPPWMHINGAALETITSEQGMEYGKISPDGKYLVYSDDRSHLKIKELEQGIVTPIAGVDSSYTMAWNPQSTYISLTGISPVPGNTSGAGIVIVNLSGKIIDWISVDKPLYQIAWSPDGTRIAYCCGGWPEDNVIVVMEYPSKETRQFHTHSVSTQLGWSPDSRKIAYLEFVSYYKGRICILDVKTGKKSAPLKNVRNALFYPWAHGLTWSPDGKFIVYVGKEDTLSTSGRCELYAVPLDREKMESCGLPIRISDLQGIDIPYEPVFADNGKLLCFGGYRSDDNIYSIPFSIDNSAISGRLAEIATSTDDEWRPCWTRAGDAVLYVSFREGQYDIYRYDMTSQEEKRLTNSKQKKDFPRESPDRNTVGFLADHRIWAFSKDGGKPDPISPESLRLDGMFDWLPDGKSLIASETTDSTCYLIQMDIGSGEYKRLLKLIFSSDFAISHDGTKLVTDQVPVLSKDSTYYEKIAVFDLKTRVKKDIYTQGAGRPLGTLSWTNDDRFILHDRRDANDRLTYELLDVNGGAPKQVRLDIGNLRGEAFLCGLDPSGKNVLIRLWSKESNLYLWRAPGKQ